MKNKIFIAILILSIMITGCKKSSAEESKNNSNSPEKTVVKKSLKELLGAMGGGMPTKPMKYFDAEFLTLDGKSVNLSDYEGKVIFLNLWATWCPPCKNEMPAMEKLYNAYKDKDFVILAVDQGEDSNTVKDFLKRFPYSFPIFVDSNNEVGQNYGSGSIPTSFLINKDGFMVARFVGGRDWFSDEAKELIDLLLE